MGNFGLIYFDALPKVVIITVVASLLMASSIHQNRGANIFGIRCRYFSSIDSRSGCGPHLPWTDRWRGSGARFERFRFSAGDREIPRADSIETIYSSCRPDMQAVCDSRQCCMLYVLYNTRRIGLLLPSPCRMP